MLYKQTLTLFLLMTTHAPLLFPAAEADMVARRFAPCAVRLLRTWRATFKHHARAASSMADLPLKTTVAVTGGVVPTEAAPSIVAQNNSRNNVFFLNISPFKGDDACSTCTTALSDIVESCKHRQDLYPILMRKIKRNLCHIGDPLAVEYATSLIIPGDNFCTDEDEIAYREEFVPSTYTFVQNVLERSLWKHTAELEPRESVAFEYAYVQAMNGHNGVVPMRVENLGYTSPSYMPLKYLESHWLATHKELENLSGNHWIHLLCNITHHFQDYSQNACFWVNIAQIMDDDEKRQRVMFIANNQPCSITWALINMFHRIYFS